MSGLWIVRYQTEDAARSPELRYLDSCLLADARSVFGHAEEIVWRPEAARQATRQARQPLATDVPPDVPVLVIGRASIHLGARSLRHMKERIEAAADIVLPGRLATFRRAAQTPIYTLRAFEQLEREVLSEGDEPGELRRSHLPVALFSAQLWTERLRALPLATLLEQTGLLAESDLEGAVTHGGIFHDYVDYYGEAREDVLPYVPEDARDVLEIGCGRGVTGRLLQERRGCRVTGVELNPEVAREAARHLHRVVVGDVEELELDGEFDAVVATELFEHLSYPEDFLVKMKSLLRPGGRIVLSVPNVGHYAIVEDLLAGRWDYLPIGLLCYTHFRFFTRATLESWIQRVGFASHQIVAQTTELPERFRHLNGFEVDLENLATRGFYVILKV